MSKDQVWKKIFCYHANRLKHVFPDFSRLRRNPGMNLTVKKQSHFAVKI